MEGIVQSWRKRRAGDTASRIADTERQFLFRFRIATRVFWGIVGTGDLVVAQRNCFDVDRWFGWLEWR